MNSLVVQHHHQNIQIHSHNLMMKQILLSVTVNFVLHIPDVPDIAYITNISTTSTSDITHPPTYEHLHRHLLTEKEGKKKIVFILEIFVIYAISGTSGMCRGTLTSEVARICCNMKF